MIALATVLGAVAVTCACLAVFPKRKRVYAHNERLVLVAGQWVLRSHRNG